MDSIGFLLLCGGNSSRMGTRKALLDLGGQRMMDAAVEAGKGFDLRIFSVNDPEIPTPPGYIRVADLHPGCGPMAGLHAAFHAVQADALVVAPCDTPLYSAHLAEVLTESMEKGFDAVIIDDEALGEHPLLGVYRRSCLPVMERNMATGRFKMKRFLTEIRTKRIPFPAGLDERCMLNLNTPEEYGRFIGKSD